MVRVRLVRVDRRTVDRASGCSLALGSCRFDTRRIAAWRIGLRKTRIFFYGPFALAVFLGQHLTSVGEIQLFEYQDPGYVLTCSLKT